MFRFNWFEITGKNNFENYLIKPFKGKDNLRFLEIGPFEGNATVWLLENILTENNSKITVIDTFDGSQEHKELGVDCSNLIDVFNENTKKWKDKIAIIVGKSQEILPVTINRINIQNKEIFDFIYVDGSHIAEDVFQDCNNSFELLKVNGIMAIDDYLWNGVTGKPEDTPKPGIDKFLFIHTNNYNLLLKEYQVWIQKV